MGQYLLFLKPSATETTPYTGSALLTGDSADADHGATGVAGTSTITIGSHENITSIKYGDNDTQSDWIVVAAGKWRILNVSGQTITIEGTIGTAFTNVVWNTYKSVPAHCKWTDVTTVTYIAIRPNLPLSRSSKANIKITRYANQGMVIINLKKFEGVYGIKSFYLGNYKDAASANDPADQGGQVIKALRYAQMLWPSTTPKYSLLYWYDDRGFESQRRYVYASSVWRAQQGVLTNMDDSEDTFNNATIENMAIEYN